MSEFKHVCVVGCGLIGGSFALALRRAGFAGRITACGGSRSPRLAVERGIVDAVEESFEQGEVCEADLIYLAAPIGAFIPGGPLVLISDATLHLLNVDSRGVQKVTRVEISGQKPIGVCPTSSPGKFGVLGALGEMTVYRVPL